MSKVIKINENDIEKLVTQYHWNLFWENFSWDMWFRFGILFIQIVTLPLTLLGIYLGCSQRIQIKNLMKGKGQKKINYHENKQFFSQSGNKK